MAGFINIIAAFGGSFAVLSQPLHDFSFTHPRFIVSVLVCAAAITLSFFNWRYPVCHKYLGNKAGITTCRKCKTQLKPEKAPDTNPLLS